MGRIILRNNIDLSRNENIGDITKISFCDKYKKNIDEVLFYLSEITSVKENLEQIIKPDIIYRAEIPKEIMNKLKSGQYDIMKTTKGELLSNIIDTTKPKNRNIVHQLRLCNDTPDISHNLQSLMNNISNIAVQRQIAEISNKLEECNEKLNSIQRGQLTDRLGKIYGGKDQIEQAFKMSDDNNLKQSLFIAIGNLNEGREQLISSLEENKRFIDDIPDNNYILFFKNLFDSKYKEECEKVYINGQVVFKGIIESSILLSIAYERMGEYDVIKRVLTH